MPFEWRTKDKRAPLDLGLLDAFERALPPDVVGTGPASGWTDKDTRSLLGGDLPLFTAFMAERARSPVGNGLLRFLMPHTQPSLIDWNGREGWRSDWPSAGPAIAFASDWTGRLYLLAKGKQIRDGEPPVALLDPAAAEVEILDYTFGEFLGDAIAADWRNLLEADRLDQWRAAGGMTPSPDQCVSPKVPLFLGGSAEIADLELMSLVVTVSLTGQLWDQVKDLPPGTPISGVSLG